MRRLVVILALAARAAGLGYHSTDPAPECPSVPKVAVITDAVTTNGVLNEDAGSDFWNLWHEGAQAAGAEVDFRGFYKIELQRMDVEGFLGAIATACDTADAIVVSVPFEAGTPAYVSTDDAINACLDGRPDIPIFSTTYDTYQNSRLYGYVGTENYAMGEKCGRALLFTEDESEPLREPPAFRDAVTGRGPALAAPAPTGPLRRCPDKTCQVYWPASLAENAGIARLVAGMNDTLTQYGYVAEIIRPSLADELALFDPTTFKLDFTRALTGEVVVWQDFDDISNGFVTLVTSVGTEIFPAHSKFVCGTVDPGEDAWQIGASPFRQGLTAVNSAAAAARLSASGGRWASAKGNNEALEVSESLTNVNGIFICSTSAQQVLPVAGMGYADHEKYMSLAVATSFFSYSNGKVGGGTVRDVYDNTCWMDGFSAAYGKPLGVLQQFYYVSGDNLAYTVHLKEQNTGVDLVVVNFRGTQGGTALYNWMTNANIFKKEFPCPQSSCENTDNGATDSYGDGCALYNEHPSWCNGYDDDDFTSGEMCCICGGGTTGTGALPAGFKCQVHSGFRTSYEGLVGVGLVVELKKLIDTITQGGAAYPKVLVSGHSLGGAMATVAAFDFALMQGITVYGLYTQGSPRVFETLTRNYLESEREFPIWRSTFKNDPVVRIPLDSQGFQHVGVEVHGVGDYSDGWGTLISQDTGDGSGQDNELTYNKGTFSSSVADHGPGPSYLIMHNAIVADDPDAPCVGGESWSPKDYGYDSCDEKCKGKTGRSKHKYHGNGPNCWIFPLGGKTGDCDSSCHDGYCTFAPTRFTDYPDGWFDLTCGSTNGRICCCEDFQNDEVIHYQELY